ncbi:unnamed protein product [Mytilus coruscus]|uniref:Uncharacterized protein n=1 Tax=Mytilus coruscus TaxID=42192 RepID=A0A6J8AEH8_MYTCO|nr:unnamed protein product [Mytilus coruscus]
MNKLNEQWALGRCKPKSCIQIESLYILFGLLHKYHKRRQRALINPLNDNEIETNETRRENQEIEERTESVYNEIDESAMKTLSFRHSFHHSYFEMTNSISSTLHKKPNRTQSSICLARLSSQSQPVRQKSLQKQRDCAKGSTNDLQIASEYSDGYLRPVVRSILQLKSIKTVSENQGTLFQNNDKVTSLHNDECINTESNNVCVCRSMSYNKLSLKDVRNQTKEIGVVDNPIYHQTVNRQYADCFLKRKTI